MKLLTTLAGIALLACTTTLAHPAQASITIDLDKQKFIRINDGDDNIYVQDSIKKVKFVGGVRTAFEKGFAERDRSETPSLAYPVPKKLDQKTQFKDLRPSLLKAARDIYEANGDEIVNDNGCPPGTQHYRTNGLFGLGARDIGCMTAFEAESLRRQNYQNFQNNLNRNRMRNCTTNFIGSTAYTNCY